MANRYDPPTLPELSRQVDRLERELDELRRMETDLAVVKTQLGILNTRLRTLIAVGAAIGVGLFGTAVSIALAIHK